MVAFGQAFLVRFPKMFTKRETQMKTMMRHMIVVHPAQVVVAVALLVSSFTSLARAEACTNQNLRGTYVFTLNAFRTFLAPPQAIGAFSPLAVGGTFRFDGNGNVSRSLLVSFAGQIFPLADTGTYAVNADCSGSTSFPHIPETHSLYLVDAKTVAIVTSTTGASGASTLTKQHLDDECTDHSLRGAYVVISNGLATFQTPPQTTDAFSPVSVAGTFTFDGKGTVSRALSLSFAGVISPYEDTGSYQVHPDCTASASFSSNAETFYLVFVNPRTIAVVVSKEGAAGTGALVKQRLD
jgi:hypothetical protein